ncbi:MAG: ATP-binding protein [Cyanobacteria bacterium J06600_6]
MSTPVSKVEFRISIAIIEHFSENLYRSPNKAVEELITNGYDAFAEEVRTYLPGAVLEDCLIVWDDGDSMNIQGIKDLWHIAASPKKNTNRLIEKGGRRRKVIGKFGIGKLASYSIGTKMSHLCKQDDQYLLIEIDYNKLTKSLKQDNRANSEPTNREESGTNLPVVQDVVESSQLHADVNKTEEQDYKENIYALTESEAWDLVSQYFKNKNQIVDDFFKKPSWTLAVISDLREDKNVTPGALSRVLGRSMPLRPDFKVYVNDEEVKSVLLSREALEIYDFGDKVFQDRLEKIWRVARKAGKVNGDITFHKDDSLTDETGKSVPYVQFPNLGKTWGKLRLSSTTLHVGKAAKIDRYYGFFVYVRGRLINPEDDKLFHIDPSYGSFYRSQYIIHADDLDETLLADRERFGESSKIDEMRILQTACSRTLDDRWDDEVDAKEKAKQFKNRLPIHRRDLFADPISMIWSKKIDEEKKLIGSFDFDLEEPTIIRQSLGADNAISNLDIDPTQGPKLMVNSDHPFIRRQVASAGKGKKGASFIREIENLMAMESLFEGHLYFLDLSEEKVEAILAWRDRMYRQLAILDNTTVFGAIQEMEDMSYVGDRKFEEAISNVLKFIGFQSEVQGLSGNPDIVAFAPAGAESYRIVFEAKGSKRDLPNTKAAVASGVSHAKEVEAEHVVIVAREFVGFNLSETPAIIKECLATNQFEQETSEEEQSKNPIKRMIDKSKNPTVSIITTDNLASLAIAVKQYQYDILTIKDVLTAIETPEQKNKRIASLTNPDYGFDFAELLEIIFEQQQSSPRKLQASLATIYDEYYSAGEKGVENEEEFKQKILALHILAFPFVPLTDERVAITESPDKIARHIANKLESFKKERQIRKSTDD